ncbi:MAG: glucokinase, partial [Pseudomonadota bacterium]
MIGTSGPYALVGDIGGTNTRVALASGDKLLPDSVRRFQNADHDGLSTVLTRYLSELGNPECRSACVAVAGPVRK